MVLGKDQINTMSFCTPFQNNYNDNTCSNKNFICICVTDGIQRIQGTFLNSFFLGKVVCGSRTLGSFNFEGNFTLQKLVGLKCRNTVKPLSQALLAIGFSIYKQNFHSGYNPPSPPPPPHSASRLIYSQ